MSAFYVELCVITDPEFHFAIGMSLSTALTSLCLAIILGVLCMGDGKNSFRGHRLLMHY